MKRRIRPVAHTRDQPVLERVDDAIFDMADIVGFIADQMLPEAALPNAAFGARLANGTETFLLRQCFGRATFDQPPAGREIAVAGRQGPDRMQMIGQDDERVDVEGMTMTCRGDRIAQGRDMVDEQALLPLQQVDREEEASARDECATIIGHVRENSTSNSQVAVEAADYAFGSNPPYELIIKSTGITDRLP